MPPVFWAYAASAAHIAHTSQPAAASTRSSSFIPVPPVRGRGPVEPTAASCRPFYWALMRDDGAADATRIRAGAIGADRDGYLSSQTSSMRQPLKMLLTMTVHPLTWGCQQVARRS